MTGLVFSVGLQHEERTAGEKTQRREGEHCGIADRRGGEMESADVDRKRIRVIKLYEIVSSLCRIREPFTDPNSGRIAEQDDSAGRKLALPVSRTRRAFGQRKDRGFGDQNGSNQ